MKQTIIVTLHGGVAACNWLQWQRSLTHYSTAVNHIDSTTHTFGPGTRMLPAIQQALSMDINVMPAKSFSKPPGHKETLRLDGRKSEIAPSDGSENCHCPHLVVAKSSKYATYATLGLCGVPGHVHKPPKVMWHEANFQPQHAQKRL